jgi:hypothetical protein
VRNDPPAGVHYAIRVAGVLDAARWSDWFDGWTFTTESGGDGAAAATVLTGPVADQAALHGLLVKIRDLNLTLLSVRRLPDPFPDAR